MPIIVSKTPSVKTISTQISLDSKKRPSHNISLNKPKKSCKTETKINTPKENQTINYEIRLNTTSKDSESNNGKFLSGKWTEEEHEKFIEGILLYGNEWKKVQDIIKTRSSAQARSHAQKFFMKIKKSLENVDENLNLNEKNKKIDDIIAEIIPKKFDNNLNKNQKDKLLSAISCNIKYEDNLNFCPDFGLDLEEFEKLSNKCFCNDNIQNKYNIISLDLCLINEQDELCKSKNILSKKRKLSNTLENKNMMNNNKKIESHRPSIDFTFNKLNEKDNDDFVFENVYNQENKENIFKNSSINSSTNEASSNSKEEKGKDQYTINNVINVTNNYINQKVVYNICNKDIFNNNLSLDLFYNDKDYINNNERYQNQNYFKIYQSHDNYINENQFNKIFNDFNKNNYKDNDFNEYEKKIENESDNINNNSDPFQLNFTSFSNENSQNYDNDRHESYHENEFIKIFDNI
jgi:SHAQKYF class myb-like DNA-binding protein